MEVVDIRMYGRQCQEGLVTCRSTSRVRGEDTDDTPSRDHPGVQLWVGSSRNCCSRMVSLHSAPRILMICFLVVRMDILPRRTIAPAMFLFWQSHLVELAPPPPPPPR